MLYTVSEIAKKLETRPRACAIMIRKACCPLWNAPAAVRMFKESGLSWLSIVQSLKKTGMPIRKIRKFGDWCLQGDDTTAQRLALIDRQRESVLEQIVQLQSPLETLNYKHWYYETAQCRSSCDALRTLNPADIPPGNSKNPGAPAHCRFPALIKRRQRHFPPDPDTGKRPPDSSMEGDRLQRCVRLYSAALCRAHRPGNPGLSGHLQPLLFQPAVQGLHRHRGHRIYPAGTGAPGLRAFAGNQPLRAGNIRGNRLRRRQLFR